jgi:YidC/Oxa1 family membrane protein insertase
MFPPPKPVTVDNNSTATTQTVKSENSAPSVGNIAQTSSAPKVSSTTPTAESIVNVDFGNSTLTVDKFGRISSKTLLDEKYRDDKGVQAQLISVYAPKPLEVRFEDSKLNDEAFKTPYVASASKLDITTGSKSVTLTQNLTGVTVTKELTFHPAGNYDFKISLSEPRRFFLSNGMRPDVSEYGFVVQGAMVKVGDEITIIEDGDAVGTAIFRDVKLTSSFDRYYATLFYNLDPTTNLIVEADKFENPMVFLEGLQTLAFSGYIGPKDHRVLSSLDSELTSAIEYGLITLIAKPLFYVLNELHSIFGNWGWAIVVLTIFIRLALYPLTYRGMVSMQKLKDLAPEIKELQRKYKGNPQQMQVKMMDLYKRHGANPMGGCLPLLLQLPIFFAIYRVLLNAVELQGEGWIFWIEDLAKMDPYFILPILMGASMFWQQHITPNNFTDPMQEKIFKFLPLIFTFFFITFPAGLTLYWFVNNMLSIAQQYIVNAKYQQIKAQKLELEKQKKEK